MVKRAGFPSLSDFFRKQARDFFQHNNVRQKTLTKFTDEKDIKRSDPFGCGKFIARYGLEIACKNFENLVNIANCRTTCKDRRKLDYTPKVSK